MDIQTKLLGFMNKVLILSYSKKYKPKKNPYSNNPNTKPFENLDPNEKRQQYQKLKNKKIKQIKDFQNQVKEYDDRIKDTYEEERNE